MSELELKKDFADKKAACAEVLYLYSKDISVLQQKLLEKYEDLVSVHTAEELEKYCCELKETDFSVGLQYLKVPADIPLK